MEIRHFIFTVFLLLLFSCKKESTNSSIIDTGNRSSSYSDLENSNAEDEEETVLNNDTYEEENSSSDEEEESGYKDGKYSANIDYYNPETGTSSTYTLNVKVRNERLVEIEWENGGWLDETHFSSVDISDGRASFTDDRGREFDVKLRDFKY